MVRPVVGAPKSRFASPPKGGLGSPKSSHPGGRVGGRYGNDVSKQVKSPGPVAVQRGSRMSRGRSRSRSFSRGRKPVVGSSKSPPMGYHSGRSSPLDLDGDSGRTSRNYQSVPSVGHRSRRGSYSPQGGRSRRHSSRSPVLSPKGSFKSQPSQPYSYITPAPLNYVRQGEPVDAAVWEQQDYTSVRRTPPVSDSSLHYRSVSPARSRHERDRVIERVVSTPGPEESQLWDLTSQVARLKTSLSDMKKHDEVRALRNEIKQLRMGMGMQPQMIPQQPPPPPPPQMPQVIVQQSHHQVPPPQQQHHQQIGVPHQPAQSQPLFLPHGSILRSVTRGSTPEIVAVETTPVGGAWFNQLPAPAPPSPVQITVQRF